jgi:hypothetical protein
MPTAVSGTRNLLREAVESVRAQTTTIGGCACATTPAEASSFQYRTDPSAAGPESPLRGWNTLAEIPRLNRASAQAQGESLCFLDHDDMLSPDALMANRRGGRRCLADLLYTDEDHQEDNRRVQPVFKPGYSLDLLDCCMYAGIFWWSGAPASWSWVATGGVRRQPGLRPGAAK